MNVKVLLPYTLIVISSIYLVGFFVLFDINTRVYTPVAPNSHDPKSAHQYNGPGPRYMEYKNMDWDFLMNIYCPVRVAFVYLDNNKIPDDAPWK